MRRIARAAWAVAASAMLLTGCSESQQKLSFSESVTVEPKVLAEAFISSPIEIKKEGDVLYASDFSGDSLLHCYHLGEQRFVKQMLPQGQGADEFLSPVEFFFSGSSMFIHNRWHFTARTYSFRADDFSIRQQGELIHLPMNVDKVYPIGDCWLPTITSLRQLPTAFMRPATTPMPNWAHKALRFPISISTCCTIPPPSECTMNTANL